MSRAGLRVAQQVTPWRGRRMVGRLPAMARGPLKAEPAAATRWDAFLAELRISEPDALVMLRDFPRHEVSLRIRNHVKARAGAVFVPEIVLDACGIVVAEDCTVLGGRNMRLRKAPTGPK